MKHTILFILFTLFFFSCKSEYEKIVLSEQEKNLNLTTLPLDLEMGISKKEFYSHCWDLNKAQKINQGSGNQYAEYELFPEGLKDSLDRVKMQFYGIFDKDDIMRGMDLVMEYYNWSPWNKKYHSPQLIEELKRHYGIVYPGNPFIPIEINSDLKASVKVDGNRRITMYPLDNQKISVKIIDLNYKDAIN